VEPTQEERDAATRLINAELPPRYTQKTHRLIPNIPDEQFSDLVKKELERVAAGEPLEGGIDMSRYEAPDEPAEDAPAEAWHDVLRDAYTSRSYLSERHVNLSLLDEFGKNAWLIGNARLADMVKDLDKEMAQLKEQTDQVNKERKAGQENARGEILGLEEAWQRGVDKIIEVQVATDGLRQEILQRRRSQAH